MKYANCLKKIAEQLGENKGLFLRHGIEKENLRVDRNGYVAQTPHPKVLGKTLTNPYITTDFAESLPELVTSPSKTLDALFEELTAINQQVYQAISGEYLWPLSMPPFIENEDDVHIAFYGNSNSAKMKRLYRLGLAKRYGRIMQSIAGIHYNVSFSDELFSVWQRLKGDTGEFSVFRSEAYMTLVRGFYCHAALLPYLFGASPICARSSIKNQPDYLTPLDNQYFYGEFATSLRMSDLGYQSHAQENLDICLNDVTAYAKSLIKATQTPYPEFTRIGVKHESEYLQLNDSILQIENEYYSFIRPKQITKRCERPATALCKRGVEYVEVRLMDLNPFAPLGIDKTTAAFLDVFLMYCLFYDCDPLCFNKCQQARHNFEQVVKYGRDPTLLLKTPDGEQSFQAWALEKLEPMLALAEVMDTVFDESIYAASVKEQIKKIHDSTLTPSGRMMGEVLNQSYDVFAKNRMQAQANQAATAHPHSDIVKKLQKAAKQSLLDWQTLEAKQEKSFEDYLASYFHQMCEG